MLKSEMEYGKAIRKIEERAQYDYKTKEDFVKHCKQMEEYNEGKPYELRWVLFNECEVLDCEYTYTATWLRGCMH